MSYDELQATVVDRPTPREELGAAIRQELDRVYQFGSV